MVANDAAMATDSDSDDDVIRGLTAAAAEASASDEDATGGTTALEQKQHVTECLGLVSLSGPQHDT